MNKRYITYLMIIFLITISGSLTAEIGIKGGIANTRFFLLPEDIPQWETFSQYQIGGFLTLKISKRLKFQPELVYIKKSAKSEKSFLNEQITSVYSFTYIQIPVSIMLSIPISSKTTLNPFFGGYLGVNLDATDETILAGTSTGESIKNVISKTETGFLTGISFKHQLSPVSVILEVRYTIGSSEMIKEPYGIESMKNNTISFLLGIGFW